jgi:hypothetical protein
MFCARRPGILLSTMKALDSLGLDIEEAVISCFDGFATDVFRAKVRIFSTGHYMFYDTVAMCTNSVNDVHFGMFPTFHCCSPFFCVFYRSSKGGILGSCLEKLRPCSYVVLVSDGPLCWSPTDPISDQLNIDHRHWVIVLSDQESCYMYKTS